MQLQWLHLIDPTKDRGSEFLFSGDRGSIQAGPEGFTDRKAHLLVFPSNSQGKKPEEITFSYSTITLSVQQLKFERIQRCLIPIKKIDIASEFSIAAKKFLSIAVN